MRLGKSIAMFALLIAQPAYAQSKCGDRFKMAAQLEGRFGEISHGIGVQQGRAFEIWSNQKTGTWTITVTTADKILCVIAAGKSWINNPDFLSSIHTKT